MKYLITTVAAFSLLALATSPARADVRITMQDGRVTLIAENATARQILAEWARVGQAKVVGAERLAGPPLTLQMTDVPEAQALQTILRAASGYMVAQRASVMPAASRYDRILILPTSTAPPVAPTQSAGAWVGGGRTRRHRRCWRRRRSQAADTARDGSGRARQSIRSGRRAGAARRSDGQSVRELDAPARDELRLCQPAAVDAAPDGARTADSAAANSSNSSRARDRRCSRAAWFQEAPQQPQSGPSTTVGAPTTSARPGEIVQPPRPTTPTFQNPSGIPGMPTPAQPTTAKPPEPDRSKYQNPYRPPPQ